MITRERLAELLRYDPESGVFSWIADRGNALHAGDRAGGVDPRGYVSICIDRRRFWCHRLAWLYMTGEFPEGYIDHANGEKGDNRWANLRLCTQSQNIANSRISSRNLSSGVKGVTRARRRWRARIKHDGKVTELGNFDTVEAAAKAYRVAAQRVFGEFARPSRKSSERRA